jgi:hypothetical protein
MFDAVEPLVMPAGNTVECPGCCTPFTPKRSNQKFCSRGCQRNAARGSRKAENKERSWKHYERAQRLAEMVYSTPPQERLGVMKHILSFIPQDAGLRNILTDPELHMEPPRADNRMNIAKAANAYTQRFYGLSIRKYMSAIRDGKQPEGIPLNS